MNYIRVTVSFHQKAPLAEWEVRSWSGKKIQATNVHIWNTWKFWQINKKNSVSLISNMGKRPEWAFLKWCSSYHYIWDAKKNYPSEKCKLKPQWFTSHMYPKSIKGQKKKKTSWNAIDVQDMEQLELSYPTDRKVNVYNHFGKHFDIVYQWWRYK